MTRKPIVFVLSTSVAFILVGASGYFLGIYTINIPLKSPDFAKILGAVGSIILSIALVTAYMQQTSIQQRQEKWMEAEHKPDIHIDRWKPAGNYIDAWIVNYGNGLARNLTVVCKIKPDSNQASPYSRNPVISSVPFYREDSPSVTTIQSGSGESIKFVMDGIHEFHGQNDSDSFKDFTEHLLGNEISGLDFQIYVVYNYIAEENDRITLWDGHVHLREPMNIKDAIEASEPHIDHIDAPFPEGM